MKASKQVALRLGEFEKRGDASRLQYSKDFEKPPLIIRQVAESKRAGNQIKAPVPKRKGQRVRLDERYAGAECRSLGACPNEHFRNEIGPYNFSAGRRLPAKCKCQVARAPAQIEH